MPQTWNPETYRRDGAFVHELAAGVLEWLAAQPGEHILDLGCGDGQLTERIAASGASVTAIDASPQMVAAARARGIAAEEGSAESLPYPDGAFDAVFSNAVLHWVRGQDEMMTQVQSRSASRRAFCCRDGWTWQYRCNPRGLCRGACAPRFCRPGRARELLSHRGGLLSPPSAARLHRRTHSSLPSPHAAFCKRNERLAQHLLPRRPRRIARCMCETLLSKKPSRSLLPSCATKMTTGPRTMCACASPRRHDEVSRRGLLIAFLAIEHEQFWGAAASRPLPETFNAAVLYSAASSLVRNSSPATMPPTLGMTRKSHNCLSAWPPANSAGPRLRAGFTLTPVI